MRKEVWAQTCLYKGHAYGVSSSHVSSSIWSAHSIAAAWEQADVGAESMPCARCCMLDGGSQAGHSEARRDGGLAGLERWEGLSAVPPCSFEVKAAGSAAFYMGGLEKDRLRAGYWQKEYG